QHGRRDARVERSAPAGGAGRGPRSREEGLMESFTPVASLVGGMLIGLAAAMLLLFSGRIAGISGIAGGLLTRPPRGDVVWRVLFVGGLLVGGLAMGLVAPGLFEFT